jgi:hypothetical protein
VLTVKPEFVASHETFAAVMDGQMVGFYALGQKDGRLDLLPILVSVYFLFWPRDKRIV